MEGQCNFFVARKKRLCRMTVRTGAKFCGEHETKASDEKSDGAQQNEDSRLRMVCPLDPKHTCYISKLERHLKVCNAKQGDLPPYIEKKCNLTDDPASTEAAPASKRSLADVPEETLIEIIALVEKLYDSVVSGNVLTHTQGEPHTCVQPEMETHGRGDGTKKHLLQTSALITIMEQHSLLKEDTCYVELGAGKGQVSYYLGSVAAAFPRCSVLVVDRASHRHKQDNRLDRGRLTVERVRADIADLLLHRVPAAASAKHLVGVSKHLCGVATDLALRCLIKPETLEKTEGLVMATCCHHRCLWDSYVGRSFLQDHKITSEQFDIICGIVSWATCGTGLSRERRAQIAKLRGNSKDAKRAKYDDTGENKDTDGKIVQLSVQKQVDDDDDSDKSDGDELSGLADEVTKLNSSSINNGESLDNDPNKSLEDDALENFCAKNAGLSLKERAEVGFKAKAIFDWGRAEYLRNNNFDTKLWYYVGKEVSPENVCIVATKRK